MTYLSTLDVTPTKYFLNTRVTKSPGSELFQGMVDLERAPISKQMQFKSYSMPMMGCESATTEFGIHCMVVIDFI